ncbi:uncharacterized protein J7T54_005956 [Emericellopsis cladophorae]|uniref:Uncharacterized protein n=1 Tax=Emericellopsis cladophorae TaxID=2686198 RepID=A0A9P9Y8T4_9HYPO|nr:uncharacterized protein J7T54_005956 [Emericellopsis cladophorae]KAI6785622.1 hypothetical protein J7T54_005956 [Emericellopsis cladophorae]
MRISVSLLLTWTLAFGLPNTSALPRPGLDVRAAPTGPGSKPQYSIIPLEPDEDDAHQPGKDSGDRENEPVNGDEDSTVTLTQTVIHVPNPVTQRITRTVLPEVETVTQKIPVPTTVISIIDLEAEPTATVYITQTPLPPVPAPQPEPASEPATTLTTTTTDSLATDTATAPSASSVTFVIPASQTTASPVSVTEVPVLPVAPSSAISPPSLTTPTNPKSQGPVATKLQPIVPSSVEEVATFTPTTFSTLVRPSQSGTYDDGQWHTSYPPWSEAASTTGALY